MPSYYYKEIRPNVRFLNNSQKELVINSLGETEDFLHQIKNGPDSSNLHEILGGAKISDSDLKIPKYMWIRNDTDYPIRAYFELIYLLNPPDKTADFSFYYTKKNELNIYDTHSWRIIEKLYEEKKFIDLNPNETVWVCGNNIKGLCRTQTINKVTVPWFWTHICFDSRLNNIRPSIEMGGDLTSLMNTIGGDIYVPKLNESIQSTFVYYFYGLFKDEGGNFYSKFIPPMLPIFQIDNYTVYAELFYGIECLNVVKTMQIYGSMLFTDWLESCSRSGLIMLIENAELLYNDGDTSSMPKGWVIESSLDEPKF